MDPILIAIILAAAAIVVAGAIILCGCILSRDLKDPLPGDGLDHDPDH